MRIIKTCLFLIFLIIASDALANDIRLQKTSFVPQWVPQAQFAGYYIADELGFYRKHGINLSMINGGPDNPPSELLKNGLAQFATLWLSSGIQMRAEGIKVVNISQIMQRSSLMLVAKKSSNIKTPADMNGKKVGLWGPDFQIQPKAFFKKYNLDIKEIRQSFSVNLFLRDGVDVASAMWFNEYHTILNSGLNPDELKTFFFHEYGLNFPEDGIYTLENTFKNYPGLCRAFVDASIEGWKYAFAHPDEALDIVLKNLHKAHIPATRVHQKWMLMRMKDLIFPDDSDVPMGQLVPEDYYRVASILKENGLITQVPDFKSFYQKCSSHGDK
ncbi:MAG TPA: ABC transporter substrate-binding protein [Desulfobacteraceae bacterium]|nr:ABC transporter substrate-binding protein [Desulfobacteraceae bacterium]HPJ68385.1 ABC transporter substrate-binding protein [Desulfobacteraceae bacterium]HPQ27739.1 ABC transporter substrate-binding protein [Desulfobacteraceae bacterium]